MEYLRLTEGFHVCAITTPDQRRGWCSGDIALNLNVVPDSRGYMIHFEGFIQRYHRYTCTDQNHPRVLCVRYTSAKLNGRSFAVQTLHNNSSRSFIYARWHCAGHVCGLTIYGEAIVYGQCVLHWDHYNVDYHKKIIRKWLITTLNYTNRGDYKIIKQRYKRQFFSKTDE